MTIALFPTQPFVDDVNVAPAAALNHFRVSLAKAVDGTGGGTYQPSAAIEINGAGIKSDNIGDSTVTGTLTIDSGGGIEAGGSYKLASRSVSRVQSMCGASAATGEWFITDGAAWLNQTAGGNVVVPLDRLPHGCTLQSVIAYFKGNTGHANDPVDGVGGITMPAITLHEVLIDGTVTQVATASDATTTKALYEAPHTIELTSLAKAIDHSSGHLALSVTGEAGTDFIADGILYGVVCTFDVDTIDEG